MDLKLSKVGEGLTCEGSSFQSLGAAIERALSLLALRREWGTERRSEEDLMDLGACEQI